MRLIFRTNASRSTERPDARWPLRVFLALALGMAVQGCSTRPVEDAGLGQLSIKPVKFSELPGWLSDDHQEALNPLRRSCQTLEGRIDGDPIDSSELGGRVSNWRVMCQAALSLIGTQAAAGRTFFENWFVPYEVYDDGKRDGLFTGYFEPELRGAYQKSEAYNVPLYGLPIDLVKVDLGLFRQDLVGQDLVGRVVSGALMPYPSRSDIEQGALNETAQVLVWVEDQIEAFFLHIQGSGVIRFDDGSQRRISFASTNGQAYFPIGRTLIERGVLSRDQISMQSIKSWLNANGANATEVMRKNQSYVFFQWLDDERAAFGPVGAQGVSLTPSRSIAVDRRFIPLTAPLWLETAVPDIRAGNPDGQFQRLMFAQDTGGALRGPVRGDIFWGTGKEAGKLAGRMKHRGRYWILLPRDLDVSEHLD